MASQQANLHYIDDIEAVADDEAHAIDANIASVTREGQTVAQRDGRTVRASHAERTGLVKDLLEVRPNLPESLRQGLFSQARNYLVLLRFNRGSSEIRSDGRSIHRSVGTKVLNLWGR